MEFINDNRFIIIDKNNSGYGDSMNQGLNIASGEYIGIVESDDFVDFNMFNSLYKYTKLGNIDIVRSNCILYWENNKKYLCNFEILNSMYNRIFQPTDFPDIFFISPTIWANIYNKDFLIKNNIKFLPTPGASYQDTSFFFKTLFKSKNFLLINESFYYYRQTNINSSVYNNSFKKAIFINKEFYEIEKYFKKDLKLYFQIEKYYNTKKIKTLLWNIKRIDKKKEYFKFFYKDVYPILKKENFLAHKFNNLELRLFNYLIKYNEEIGSDIFLNCIDYNITHPKISIIIPIFNYINFIEECLNSLIIQSFKNFEIICINDETNVNSLNILKELEIKDERIKIINQTNITTEIAINIALNKSKGEYLMFLNSDDIFNKLLLEKIYAKIKRDNSQIVICNSQLFNAKNYENIFYKNYYLNFNELKPNNSFSIMDIKNNFFNILFWYPWDKLFKKDLIKNLKIRNPLISTNILNFIFTTIISSNKISYLNSILINHRIEKNISEKSLNNFYYELKELKKNIKANGLYKRFKQDFINYVATYSIWQLENINGKSFCFLYQKLKNEWWKEFYVTKYNKKYFYDLKAYKKINYILKTQIKQNKTINILKTMKKNLIS